MKFVDYVTITVRSGKGGSGCVSFRRERFEPMGGPDGGDGGDGASVIMEGDSQLYTLLDLRYNRHHFAKNGKSGGGNNRTGKSGEDIIIRVPVGTVVRKRDTEEIIGEIMDAGDRIVLAKGGRGGKGNAFFKNPTRQTPRFAQEGEAGEELEVALELKLLADVGLVGFPNAGKSTLISSISAAKPKVADYPFTTLEPALGVVSVGDYKSFVMADIPGIIEDAHKGKGLGIQFLKHIERNAMLLFVIPVTEDEPGAAYKTLSNELVAFNPELSRKTRMIALSKIDLIPEDEIDDFVELLSSEFPEEIEVIPISSVARKGLDTLRNKLWMCLEEKRADYS